MSQPMNLPDLQQYIRFQIDQLSANNGPTEFEKICLYYARFRIHRNIIPATGPVQAGGDQGRDFETFHTYLSKSEINKSSFLADDSTGPVAFACSLQKDPTKKNGKIATDVKVITSSGVKVERIYFFSGHDVPVAARHKIQAFIKREFNLELEVIDAQALSLHLCDSDLFWIASQFLKVSSELFPRKNEENWYEKLKKEYEQRKPSITTFQEFEEVKRAIRYIYKNNNLKSDLTFWHPKLDDVIKNKRLNRPLVRKAIYEKFVTSFIGLKFVEGQDENIKNYFSDFEEHLGTPELEDAHHLLSFCNNSRHLHQHHLSADFLEDIACRLENTMNALLAHAPNVDNRAMLLEIQANFQLNDFRSDNNAVSNYDSFIDRLDELLECLEETHFFPISKLSDRLTEYIRILLPVIVDITDLEEIAREVDEIYAKKGGMAVTGDKLRDRAIVYLKAGNFNKVIKLLHELKIKWFNKDTQEGMIVTCLLLADTYSKMGLLVASKYFSMVAAYLAFKTRDTALSDKVIPGLVIALACDYSLGAWLSYLRLMPVLLLTHQMSTKDFDLYQHEDSTYLLYYPAIIFESARRFIPRSLPVLDAIIHDVKGFRSRIQEFQDDLKEKFDDQEFKQKLDEDLVSAPFSDLGPQHEITFNGSGCDWHFSFKNDFLTTAIAEEFIATFQIILLELSEVDLNLLPGRVRIHLVTTDTHKGNIDEVITQQDELMLLVELPFYKGRTPSDRHRFIFDQIVFAQLLLYKRSMLSQKNYEPLVAPMLKDQNIISKVSFGQSYEAVYREFYTRNWFDPNQMTGIWTPFNPTTKKMPENAALPAKKGLSAIYDAPKALELIHNRINNLQKPLSVSLPLLKSSTWFQKHLAKLKKEGWLDWQIMHALAHIVLHHKTRADQTLWKEKAEAQRKHHFELLNKDESEWYEPMNDQIINIKDLKVHLQNFVSIAVLPAFGLENKSIRPEMPLINMFLKERFRFFEDGKDLTIFSV